MTADDRPRLPERASEARRVIRVSLTARQIAALRRATWAITCTDDESHCVNYADSALRAFRQAALDQ